MLASNNIVMLVQDVEIILVSPPNPENVVLACVDLAEFARFYFIHDKLPFGLNDHAVVSVCNREALYFECFLGERFQLVDEGLLAEVVNFAEEAFAHHQVLLVKETDGVDWPLEDGSRGGSTLRRCWLDHLKY